MTTMTPPPETMNRLLKVASNQPYPLIFATISGAHLYGFPSQDSDYDLRGVHALPAHEVVGLDEPTETIEVSEQSDDLELDLVTHDIRKFALLMLKKNGYVLEQLYSPLVVLTTAEHDELKAIGRDCITKHHAHHYLGFARRQWQLFEKERPPRVKPLLYVYRVLLTGIHLMRTGRIEANLVWLNEVFKLPYIADLIEAKLAGGERSKMTDVDLKHHRSEHKRLTGELEKAHDASELPERPAAKPVLHDLIVRLRFRT